MRILVTNFYQDVLRVCCEGKTYLIRKDNFFDALQAWKNGKEPEQAHQVEYNDEEGIELCLK